MRSPDVSVQISIGLPPAAVWAAVADPTRIASWSPESSAVRSATTGPLPVGARFGGSNRNGVFRWSTQCTVVESLPAEAFAFEVSFGGLAVARWRYALTPDGDGCLVDEQWWDRRGRLMKVFGVLGTGVVDRAGHNERTMRQTLSALRADLESAPG